MKLLLIGSEGFIGRHCVQYFLNKQWEVTGCDLVDYTSASYTYFKISRLQPSYEPVFEDATYDVCINAAGNGSVPVSIAHPLTDFEANCYDVVRVLELLRTKNPSCKYIHFSSAAVYGNPVQLPVAETDRLSPLSPYGWHKLIAEQLCQEYHRLYNLPVVILRPFSVYGTCIRRSARRLAMATGWYYTALAGSRGILFIYKTCAERSIPLSARLLLPVMW
jgi:UDP-glucose 4-epimerase